MKMARDMIMDLQTVFKRELKTLTEDLEEETSQKRLLYNIFQCYRDNLCVYGGSHSVGYINLRTKDIFPIHPSSSFHYLGNIAPRLIVHDKTLSTSRTFLLNLSVVKEEWLDEDENRLLQEAMSLIVTSQSISPIGTRILLQSIIGHKGSEMKKLEAALQEMVGKDNALRLQCNVKDG